VEHKATHVVQSNGEFIIPILAIQAASEVEVYQERRNANGRITLIIRVASGVRYAA
jgi:hypothetical protein